MPAEDRPEPGGQGPQRAFPIEREEFDRAQVDAWARVFDETYQHDGTADGFDFQGRWDLSGWERGADNTPIPVGEMDEWVTATVERIMVLLPRRVLEIGCGTGLLLSRLAPDCERYVGTDISAVTLDRLSREVAERGLDSVSLYRTPADDLSVVGCERFDAVLINSVVQYFPSADYLRRVIGRVAALVEPGGHIFVGDVRNLPLLDAFQLDTELALLTERGETRTMTELTERLRDRAELDDELVVDPAFFTGLRGTAGICHVTVEPRRGRGRNEMTKFRYDVTMRVDRAAAARMDHGDRTHVFVDPPETWSGLDALRASLLRRPPRLALRDLPDARAAGAVAAARRLPDATDLDDLRAAAAAATGVEVEDLYELAARTGYRLQLSVADGTRAGRFDAVFTAADLDASDRTASDRTASDRTASDLTVADLTAADLDSAVEFPDPPQPDRLTTRPLGG